MTRLAEVLVLGASLGALYALMGASVTVVYQAVRVPNVAFVAIGTVAAALHWDLVSTGGRWAGGMNWWTALVPALGLAVVLGLLTDRIVRRVEGRPGASLLVLLGWTAVLFGATTAVWSTRPKLLPGVWSGPALHLGNLTLPRQQVGSLLVGAACCLGVLALYRHTRLGLGLRASAADVEGARLMGVDPGRLSMAAWSLSSVLATVAVILVAYPVLSNTYEQTVYLPFAFGAALLGGLRSLPLTLVGGFLLGIVPAVLEPSNTLARIGGGRNLIAFILIALLMMRRPKVLSRLAEGEWGTGALPGGPYTALAAPGWLRQAAVVVVVGLLAVVVPIASSDAALVAWTHGIVVFLVCASIVVLSGWAGELPLGQVAFAGVGAYMAANLAVRLDVPHLVAVPLAAASALPVALAAGLPAFRRRGSDPRMTGRLPFAITSVGLMVVGSSFLWGPRGRWFTGDNPAIRRPDWMEAFSGNAAVSYYLLALALAGGVVWFSLNLRRSRVGRALAAVRDSEAGARTLGIDPARYRLVALAFSAFVAGLGGVLHAYLAGSLEPGRFAAFLSVQYLLYTVVGGSGSLAGSAAVVWAFEVAPNLGGAGAEPPGLVGPGAVVLLGALAMATVELVPGGLAGVARRLARAVLPAHPPAPAVPGGGADMTELEFDG